MIRPSHSPAPAFPCKLSLSPAVWALVLILVAWAVLYLPSLRTFPGWYGDETLAVTAAQHLFPFPPSHRSFENTFWHPYAPYQPLYLGLVRLGLACAGGDILGARWINVLLGLGVALVLYCKGRTIIGFWGALAAALWFLSYEQSVLHFRWVFTHNLISLGFAWTFLSLCSPASKKNDLSAGLGLAVAAAALPLAVYGVVAALLVRWKHPRSWFRIVWPSALVVFLSLLAGALLASSPAFLLSDLKATFDFYTGATAGNSGSIGGAILNLLQFASHDWWHIAGFLAMGGALFWPRLRPAAAGAWIIAVLLTQNRQNLPVFYYQAIILLPLMIFCVAGVLVFAIRRTCKIVRLSPRLRLVCKALLPATALISAASMAVAVQKQNFLPRNQPWVTQNTAEVEAAADWINTRVGADDLVICHHNIAWLLRCRTADYLQWMTWRGVPTWPFATPLPGEQFVLAADLSRARFAIVGDIDQVWTFHQPEVAGQLVAAGFEKWPVVWSGEWYAILQNPDLPDLSDSKPTDSTP